MILPFPFLALCLVTETLCFTLLAQRFLCNFTHLQSFPSELITTFVALHLFQLTHSLMGTQKDERNI